MLNIPEEIKEAFLTDNAVNNIRLHFPNGERTDITNEMIVSGTAKLTDSLCSQNELKFGLSESPTFECETVGVGNIKGATFYLTYEIECSSSVEGSVWKNDVQKFVYEMKMGKFVCSSCERQADLQHRKIVAYGGGAAMNWNFPEYEVFKVSRGLSTSNYSGDLVKVAFSLFDCQDFRKNELALYEGRQVVGNAISFDNDFSISLSTLVKVSNRSDLNLIDAILNVERTDIDSKSAALNNALLDIKNIVSNETWEKYYNYIMPRVNLGYTSDRVETFFDDYAYFLLLFNENNNIYPYLNTGKSGKAYIVYAYEVTIRDKKTSKIIFENNYPISDKDSVKLYECNLNTLSQRATANLYDYRKYLENDLQQVFANAIELKGLVAKTSGNGVLWLVDLKKQFNLIPNEELLPSDDLKPLGVTGGSITKSMYSECWYDENYTKPYGAIVCQYKNTNNEDRTLIVYCEGFTEQSRVDSYRVYDISNNDIIKNNQYTDNQIRETLQTIANAISGVTYVPVQLKCIALPYVESGDTLEVLTENNDSITTIVLRRTTSGESYITDEITSK